MRDRFRFPIREKKWYEYPIHQKNGCDDRPFIDLRPLAFFLPMIAIWIWWMIATGGHVVLWQP